MLIYLQMIETEEDRSKFEQIFYQYGGLMRYIANEILHNTHDAEDAVHDALTAIAENISKISDPKCQETRSYIVIITERKAIDIIRSRRRIVDADFNEELFGIHIPPPGDHGLADMIAKLPARYREILMLRFDHGYSTKELAKMLGMTQSGVQQLIYRAKTALKRIYEEKVGAHE